MNNDKDFAKFLAKEFTKRNNPTDLKEVCFGFVSSLSPLSVTAEGGAFTFTEGDDLFISEQFRFRCDIDKTTALSSDVPSLLDSAKAISETHSYTGSPCSMPSAVDYLAQAIEKVKAELLALKCELSVGDKVIIAPVEDMHGAYILLDKVMINVS